MDSALIDFTLAYCINYKALNQKPQFTNELQ